MHGPHQCRSSTHFCRGCQSRTSQPGGRALQADQSTVSRKVARLEQEVGSCSSSGSAGTSASPQAGRRLVGRAERILDDLRDAIAEPKEPLPPRAAGSASPSCTRSGLAGFRSASPLLESYRRSRFTLEEGTTAEVMSGVLAVTTISASSAHRRPGWSIRDPSPLPRARRRGGPGQPPSGRRSSCTLEDVAGEPLILPDPERAPAGHRRCFRGPGADHPRRLRGRRLTIVQAWSRPGWGRRSCRCRFPCRAPGWR